MLGVHEALGSVPSTRTKPKKKLQTSRQVGPVPNGCHVEELRSAVAFDMCPLRPQPHLHTPDSFPLAPGWVGLLLAGSATGTPPLPHRTA